MKTKMSLQRAALLLVSLMIVSGFAIASNRQLRDGVSITIHQVPNEAIGAPRTVCPFFAEYNETLSAVMLGCNDSIGDVTVTLESTAGDWYQTEFDTSDGAILIPASGDSGHYTLTIETAAHVVYEGEFYL